MAKPVEDAEKDRPKLDVAQSRTSPEANATNTRMKTTAAVLHAVESPFVLENVDLETPRAGEVLVRVTAAGICHSDWHLVTGATAHPLPLVAGHEGAGVVETVGEGVTRVQPGDHVALNWAPSCGDCFYCTKSRPSLCSTFVEPLWAGTMLDGSTRLTQKGAPIYHYSGLACFAERAVVPEVCAVKLDAEVPAEVAALIGCAVTTGVGAVVNTADVPAGASVCVWGAGGVGLSSILAARMRGASTIIAVDRSAAKCELAREFGATHTVVAGDDATEAAAEVCELTGGRGADYVFEAVGVPALQEAALEAVRPGGALVLVGISPVGSATNFPGALLTRQEKTVMGCYYGTTDTARDFPLYAKWYQEGKLDLDRLVSRRYRLHEINEAYAAMLRGDDARGVIVF